MTEFSVLLPVYQNDVPAHFRRAITSVTAEQTLPPSELVIVRDGPVPEAIEDILRTAESGGPGTPAPGEAATPAPDGPVPEEIEDILRTAESVGPGTPAPGGPATPAPGGLTGGVPVRVIRLAENGGLARALEAGLAACAHEIVARADADDISLPERFSKQVPLVAAGLDLLGSAITEFSKDETQPGAIRRLPEDSEEIARICRFRDPFNHPSVVYRKSAVARAGGYEHLDKMEDYWLFARMIAQGARTANLPESLVYYRVGEGAYHRRGGWQMLSSEIALQRRMLRIGFISPLQAARNVTVRGGYRLIPTTIRERLYRGVLLREANGAAGDGSPDERSGDH